MASEGPPHTEEILCVRVPCRDGKERVWQAIEMLALQNCSCDRTSFGAERVLRISLLVSGVRVEPVVAQPAPPQIRT
jgi:hypothetical protein